MRFSTIAFVLFIAAVVLGLAAFGIVWRPSIAEEASHPAFPSAEIARGAQLAAIGNCITCHTKPDGVPFAGGRPIATPFGTIYSTNITPHRGDGIGGWSEAAFSRAMKDGVRRDGEHLYPAFPYDHMTRMRDEDIRAVYAFMMTRRPVASHEPGKRPAVSVQHPCAGRRLEAAVPRSRHDAGRRQQGRRMESRRLPGRRAWPLRLLSHTTKHPRCREDRPSLCRRRIRRLDSAGTQCSIARCRPLGQRPSLQLSPPRLRLRCTALQRVRWRRW